MNDENKKRREMIFEESPEYEYTERTLDQWEDKLILPCNNKSLFWWEGAD